MIILGIETSCDETAAAVVENGTKILSNVIASSADMHAKTGGIIPEQAARQQVKSIIPVVNRALHSAFGKKSQTSHFSLLTSKIDALAITVGPGLIGSLLVGVETAKTLSYLWDKPIVPVNHLPAHLYANWLRPMQENGRGELKSPKFPALALVVSGGHTDLVLMQGHGNLKWLGGTRDDAAGEAFDKTARLLDLPYPGGPSISVEAEKFLHQSPIISHQSLTIFPRPMIDKNNFDFSFSGLKTAVLRTVQTKDNLEQEIPEIAANIQEAIADVLVAKTLRAVKKFQPKSLLLAGGVAANARLREKFKLEIENWKLKIDFHVPPPHLCTDNATYIAAHAYFNYHPIPWQNIKANPQLTITGEWIKN